MPAGFGYGPFHPDHGPLPEDATERLEFMCSSDLVRQWSDFHHTIRPLLVPPKLHYPSRQALYADLLWREDQWLLIEDFWYELKPSMLKRYRDLCLPVTDPFDEDEIIDRLARLELMSLDGRYIEMKISACIFLSLIRTFGKYHGMHKSLFLIIYSGDFRQYSVELRNCCSAWDKLRGVGDHGKPLVLRTMYLRPIPFFSHTYRSAVARDQFSPTSFSRCSRHPQRLRLQLRILFGWRVVWLLPGAWYWYFVPSSAQNSALSMKQNPRTLPVAISTCFCPVYATIFLHPFIQIPFVNERVGVRNTLLTFDVLCYKLVYVLYYTMQRILVHDIILLLAGLRSRIAPPPCSCIPPVPAQALLPLHPPIFVSPRPLRRSWSPCLLLLFRHLMGSSSTRPRRTSIADSKSNRKRRSTPGPRTCMAASCMSPMAHRVSRIQNPTLSWRTECTNNGP
jgi:hypothetical protein